MNHIFFIILLFVILPTYAQVDYDKVVSSDKGTLSVGIKKTPANPKAGEEIILGIEFINPDNKKIQEHIDYRLAVTKDDINVFGPIPLTHTNTGSVEVPMSFKQSGKYEVTISIEGILLLPIIPETVVFDLIVGQSQQPANTSTQTQGDGGGCLIATATFGSELSPQVQMLREIRDDTVLSTSSGAAFMTAFNWLYYSFSPTVADWERQNPMFKEIVKIAIMPLISSLSLLQYVDVDTEVEVLGYGIGIILLNIGMYFVAPAIIILKLKPILRTKFVR